MPGRESREILRLTAAAMATLAAWLPVQAEAAIPTSERDALIAIYSSTNGASWTTKTNWLDAAGTECTWYGVTCDAGETTVTRLALAANGLTGSIPAQIGGLTSLEYLDLSDAWGADSNRITGAIPHELGSLVRLQELSLQQNLLSGSIPPEIGSLGSLTALVLAQNQLTGSIPPEIGSLVNLTALRLDYNGLSGTIPSALGNLTKLAVLSLRQNQLTGSIPAELGALVLLQWLQLDYNQLSGPIPPQLGSLAALTSLSLGHNQLTGVIPPELGNLASLDYLSLEYNQLSGSIPAQLGGLASLRTMRLGRNRLSGTIPPELGSLTSLVMLYLSSNQLGGPIPTTLANLTSLPALGGLSLSYNALYSTDAALTSFLESKSPSWRQWQTIAPTAVSVSATSPSTATVSWTPIAYTADAGGYRVYLSTTSGGGYGLAATTANKAATSATLDGLTPGTTYFIVVETVTSPGSFNDNTVTSERTAEVALTAGGGFPTAERNALIALYNSTNGASWLNKPNWLGPAGTECTWYGVTCNAGSTAVVQLQLPFNQLNGPLPAELGSLTSLRYLYLHENQLTGAIPAELGSLASLQELVLSGNQLSGSLPAALGGLTQLVRLSLSRNQLSGSLPEALGTLASLEYMYLGNNQLSGPIPVELGNLASLRYLYLSSNQLSGPIPAQIGGLVSLDELDLSANQLNGSIPAALGTLAHLTVLAAFSNQLSGTIPPELGNLANLQALVLSFNQLSGTIPPELGRLSRLEGLALSSNQLDGPVPKELGGLAALGHLYLNGNQLSGPIPAELASLGNLIAGRLDLRWNALRSTDAGLTAFLDGKQLGGDWRSTQTIAPTGVSAGGTGASTGSVSWAPIAYTGDTGGYRVLASTTSGSGYTLLATTADKSATGAGLGGLAPATTYYVVVETRTDPHSNNPNTVTSERTAEVSLTTSPPPAPTVTGFAPPEGPVGTPVTLTGTGFLGATAVAFNGTSTSIFTVDSATSIGVDVPPGATTGPISVTTAGGTGTSSTDFTVTGPAPGFYTVDPCRIFDSRDPALGGPNPLAAGTSATVAVAGRCGVSLTATAVSLNVTATQATGPGHLRLYPTGGAVPTASTINFVPSATRANNAVVPLGTSGQINVYDGQVSGWVHFILDVGGYFESGGASPVDRAGQAAPPEKR
jgi:Leucine-rich repeat (LRR) protein